MSEAQAKPHKRTVNLALQGGGSHGAFTAGVLDALLEDGRLRFEGISGTSAGAMNAVVLANAIVQARDQGLKADAARQAVREGLRRFWGGVGLMGNFVAGVPLPGAQTMMTMLSQWISPTLTNSWVLNPLRSLLEREVDFERLIHQRQIKLFITATNVRTGRGEIFKGKNVSADAVMASACLPTLFEAVKIGDDYYWDGGFSGNPAIHPLIYHTDSADILLVQINPIESTYTPSLSAAEIVDRVNEITFNAPLLAEIRAIDFVTRLLDEGRLDPERYKRVFLHRVDGGAALSVLNASSKLRADSTFIHRLYDMGYTAGYNWLRSHFNAVGVRSSIERLGPGPTDHWESNA